jgi:hypothetical protein
VFDRYVRPFLNKSPQQMVEFYDREAGNIIDRLSQERRSLAAQGKNTLVHETVIGKLREGLSALPEETLSEVRRRSAFQAFPSRGVGTNLGSFGGRPGADDEGYGKSNQGPFYLQIDGKTYKQKGRPKEFSNMKAIQGYSNAMMRNNLDLKGRITFTKKP